MFSESEKKYILTLAHQAIEHYLATGTKLVLGANANASVPLRAPINGVLIEPRACFVTLKKNIVELRGCIGHVEAFQSLYLDVIDNATAAAFEDARFFPVTKDELPEIEIEVSVLTVPQLLVRANSSLPLHGDGVIDVIRVGVDGVIVKKGDKSATYLPQVWDEMLEKHNFLSSLCLKAGLEPDDWQKPGIEIYTYQVESITDEAVGG